MCPKRGLAHFLWFLEHSHPPLGQPRDTHVTEPRQPHTAPRAHSESAQARNTDLLAPTGHGHPAVKCLDHALGELLLRIPSALPSHPSR